MKSETERAELAMYKVQNENTKVNMCIETTAEMDVVYNVNENVKPVCN